MESVIKIIAYMHDSHCYSLPDLFCSFHLRHVIIVSGILGSIQFNRKFSNQRPQRTRKIIITTVRKEENIYANDNFMQIY